MASRGNQIVWLSRAQATAVGRVEGGWVTGRRVEYYLSDQPWLSPSDTFLVRAGIWY